MCYDIFIITTTTKDISILKKRKQYLGSMAYQGKDSGIQLTPNFKLCDLYKHIEESS
jgi:hypothetical protein